MALLNIIDQISTEIDNRRYSVGIFLDLSKAFDTIDHNILLTKPEIYGIRGVALQWFLATYQIEPSWFQLLNPTLIPR